MAAVAEARNRNRTPAAETARAFRSAWLIVACMALPTMIFVTGVYKPALALVATAGRISRPPLPPPERRWDDDDAASDEVSDDRRYLGGLLAATFDEQSCLSRYRSNTYRKPSPHKPSPYLVEKLRQYEERHRRCAPHTAPFNRTLKHLNTRSAPEEETGLCRYVLWTPWSGLGNRILSLASAFLYALLTGRVVLINRGQDMAGLFCEPFPDTTWLLPPEFPISDYDPFNRYHPMSYGNLLKNNKIVAGAGNNGTTGPPPSFVYLHLAHDYGTEDMHFFCEPDQEVLRRVPWLFLRTDNYLVPAFFLNRDFEPELSRMFPEKETVFHHLSRYLFHPTNDVWGLITRYYRSYLAAATERLGVQIRIFNAKDSPFDVVLQQVINCTQKEGLLPEVNATTASYSVPPAGNKIVAIRKVVLLTSLYSGYLEKMKDMYWEHPATGGTVVTVHQPTHEERQQTDKSSHDAKAWAEMNLLSLTEELVTSAWSTFGYTAQGLGGVRPWILARPKGGVAPQPSCVRDISMEPCFHSPPWYVCREKKNGDNAKVVPFVTHCRDVAGGLKLVDRIDVLA